MQSNNNIVRIGASLTTSHQVLIDLWPQIRALRPELKFQIVNFENTPENAQEILAHLGQNIDIVAGIFDETMLNLRGCAAFELSRQPLCGAMTIYQPLAHQNRLAIWAASCSRLVACGTEIFRRHEPSACGAIAFLQKPPML